MNAVSLHRPWAAHDRMWSWTVSLLLHGLAIGAAIVLVADLRLAPQPEPFRWVVSRTEPRTQAEAPAQAPSSRLAQDTPASAPSRVETERAARTAAPPPPPAQEIVRRNEPEVAPPPKTDPDPIQAKAKPVEPTPAPAPIVPQQTLSQAIRQTEAASVEREAAQTPRSMPLEAPIQTGPVAQPVPDTAATASQETAEPLQVHESRPRTPVVTDALAPQESAQVAALAPTLQPAPASPSGRVAQAKVDYGWLAGAILARVEQLKHYPHIARANRWEGRVVLRAVVGEDGRLVDVKIAESSGHSILDEAALDVLKKAAPLTLPQPLGRPQVVVQVPISYKLR